MNLRRQLAAVRKWFPFLVLSVVIAGAGAFAISSTLQRVYEAKAVLIVGQSLSAVNPDYSQLLASQRLSTTYASVATTRPLLKSVIDQLGLPDTPEELRKRLRADAPTDSTLLTISAQDPDPERAAAIANALAAGLIAQSPALQGRAADLQKSIDDDLKVTLEEITSYRTEIERLTRLPSRTAAQDLALVTLQDALTSLRSSYATLLTFSAGNSSSLLTLVEPAVAPETPVSPRPLLNTLLAVVVGLMIASAIAVVVEYLDDAVQNPDDVQHVAGLPTLGSIIRMKGHPGRDPTYRLATLLFPRSIAAEAYRTLRTNIEFASVDTPVETLLVTSSIPGEGKTVTAANLALTFAQAGRRVLLIDADLRKPGVHAIFKLPNTSGLTTLLRSDDDTLDAVARVTDQDNLRVVTAGPLPPNPAELLGSKRMRTILERLKAHHDLVIIDSPPLHVVADASILSSFVDGTILVINAGHTREGTVRHAREVLARADSRVIGAVLNRVAERSQSEYYGHRPDHYGSPEEADKVGMSAEQSPGATTT